MAPNPGKTNGNSVSGAMPVVNQTEVVLCLALIQLQFHTTKGILSRVIQSKSVDKRIANEARRKTMLANVSKGKNFQK